MSVFNLMLMGLGYVFLQSVALKRTTGLVHRAAFIAVPTLCFLIILSVIGSMLGLDGAEIGAEIAVPVGILYLVVLLGGVELWKLYVICVRYLADNQSEPYSHTERGTGRTARATVRSVSQGL